MTSAPLSTETWDLLEPKVKSLWRFQAAISGVVLSIISVPIELALHHNRGGNGYSLPPGVITGVLLLLTVALPIILAGKRYDTYRYRLGESDLAVAHGIFWRSQRFINRARIQHVDIQSGVIARALGLCELSVFVGGQVGAAVQIPGLNTGRAEEIRNVLLAAASPPLAAVPPVVEESVLAPPTLAEPAPIEPPAAQPPAPEPPKPPAP